MSEDSHKVLDKWLKAREFQVIGKNARRVDALDKAMGRAKYVEDNFFDRMAFGRIVTSRHPHALIKKFDLGKANRVPGVLSILTAKDIPGVNIAGFLRPDQPLLAGAKTIYNGEPVAIVVAETPEAAARAAELVEVDYKPIPAVLDPVEAIDSKVLVHEELGSNVATTTKVERGNIEEGFSKADVVVEKEYRTPYQDHIYIETEAAVALPVSDGVKVLSMTQYPHLSQMTVSRVLGVQRKQVEVVQATIGGAFGGKDDMGPLLDAKASLAAYKLQRPVMVSYSREDSLISHCKRDPAIIKYKSGVDSQGRLTAIDVKIIFDSGAYSNRGPFTLWRATICGAGPYDVPNARILGWLVYTNKVSQGSFRGFGNAQNQFAVESQMDELAHRLGMDPIEFRLKNILKTGCVTIGNQVLDDYVGIGDALAKVDASGNVRRGIGVGCAWHGISTSSGVPDWSSAALFVNKDGSVVGYTGIVEIGQGTKTAHTQIVAEILGLPMEYITVESGTTMAPDTGATHASRGTGIGGIGMLMAAEKIRERVIPVAARMLSCAPEEVKLRDGAASAGKNKVAWPDLVKKCYEEGAEMSATGYFFFPRKNVDDKGRAIFAYPAFSSIVNIAEVEVDVRTGQVKLLNIWPAMASGRIINPLLVEGQVEGAISQGIGYSMMEKTEIGPDGRVANASLSDYIIPTSSDMPEIQKPIYVEDLFKFGPFGAKGVGEMALIPTSSAIANAIFHATGVRMQEIPITPEKLYMALKKKGSGVGDG